MHNWVGAACPSHPTWSQIRLALVVEGHLLRTMEARHSLCLLDQNPLLVDSVLKKTHTTNTKTEIITIRLVVARCRPRRTNPVHGGRPRTAQPMNPELAVQPGAGCSSPTNLKRSNLNYI